MLSGSAVRITNHYSFTEHSDNPVHSLTFFVTMARYNRWMNENIYACCEGIDDRERRRDGGAFFKSIHGTLNHILLGDRLWLGRFNDVPYVISGGLDDELFADFSVLKREREKTDAEILEFIGGIGENRLSGDLHYTTFVNPHPRITPMWHALMHFFNHQTHHRGQVTTLITQAGIDPGVTDLLYLPDAPAE